MAFQHIRLSQTARAQLVKLKRSTKIEHWNVLCRWAFCISLAEQAPPTPAKIPSDSTVEMTWKVFGGAYDSVYMALLKERCHRDGLKTSDDVLMEQLRLHLHRGIGYLSADRSIKNISELLKRVSSKAISLSQK